MTPIDRRRRAARKGVATRAANRSWREHWDNVLEPSEQRMDGLFNHLLAACGTFSVRLNPLGGQQMRLKGGVTEGKLIKVKNGGRTISVRPDGYKKAMDFHPSFWEPMY